MRAVKPSDWKTEPMPERRATFAFDRSFSEDEMAAIRRGVIPEQMEDKWFIYWQDDALYCHRCWTGFCTYIVRFDSDGDAHRITEVMVNRDEQQYGESEVDEDRHMLALLDRVLLRRHMPEAVADMDVLKKWNLFGCAILDEHPQDDAAES